MGDPGQPLSCPDSRDAKGKEKQAGRLPVSSAEHLPKDEVPAILASTGLPSVGDRHALIYNHTNKCTLASVNERQGGQLDCMAKGPVAYGGMGKSTPTQSGTELGANPCSHVLS